MGGNYYCSVIGHTYYSHILLLAISTASQTHGVNRSVGGNRDRGIGGFKVDGFP